MASDEREPKLRKLNALRAAVPFVSQSALSAILKHVQNEGIPDLSQAKHMREATSKLLSQMARYGPLFQEATVATVDGKHMPLVFVNFLSYLDGCFAAGGPFTQYMMDLHDRKPSSPGSPWQLLIYTDECHPGNQLSSGARKCWNIYVSFAEFQQFLGKEDCWFCTLVKRSADVAKMEAGISQIVKVVLEDLFDNKFADPRNGVMLVHGEQRFHLCFSLGGFIQDGAAQRGTWMTRQDTGSRPCHICKNIFVLRDWQDDEEPVKIFAHHPTHASLQIASDKEIMDSWARLGERYGTCSRAEFNDRQQAAGLTFNGHALLSSGVLKNMDLLRPVTGYLIDWMHCFLSHGILNFMTFEVLQCLDAAGMPVWDGINAFMHLWQLPQAQKSCSLQAIFESKAIASFKKAHCLKCSASQVLALLKPLEYYLQACCMPQGLCPLQCQCLLAWIEVVDFVSTIHTRKLSSPEKLLQLVEKAMIGTIEAGFENVVRPKFHWALHMPQILAKWKDLPSCFAMERKHKTVRRFGSNVMNTTKYEQSVLNDVLREHLAHLANAELFAQGSHLIHPASATKKVQKLLQELGLLLPGVQPFSSKTCRLESGAVCSVGDFVFLETVATQGFPFACGLVEYFLDISNLEMALLHECSFVEHKVGAKASKWKLNGPLRLAAIKNILAPVCFSKGSNDIMTCLTPAALSQAK